MSKKNQTNGNKINMLEYIEALYGEYDFFEDQRNTKINEYDFNK